MENTNLSPEEKIKALEYAAVNYEPDRIEQVCAELGEIDYTAVALGIACRFRGLDCVKALVNGGAKFDRKIPDYMVSTYRTYDDILSVMLLTEMPKNMAYFHIAPSIGNSVKRENGETLYVISIEERLKILDYLYENREKAMFDINELLFYAIFMRDTKVIERLKKHGSAFTEYRRKLITDKGKQSDWYIWTTLIENLSAEDFIPVLTDIIAETDGKKLHCTSWIYEVCKDKFTIPENLRFYLDNFDKPKLVKTDIMTNAIKNNNIDVLEFAANEGWLNQPRKRDEIIKFASDNKMTEALAWLLDFKNRTADYNAERIKQEKKIERELNAAPDSVSEMKRSWNFKKRDDGTLIITSCKNGKTEILVPEKIGNNTVTAIGNGAFSPEFSRLSFEKSEFLKNITEVTLPETITYIGESAFFGCKKLPSVKIPDSVTEIGLSAFGYCKSIQSIDIPDSVTVLGAQAFLSCESLSFVRLSNNIERIENETFLRCGKLESIEIPRKVREIGERAFADSALKAVTVPGSVQKIEKETFCCCRQLETVIIQDGVCEIGKIAFLSCFKLKTIEIPASVSKIVNCKEEGKTVTPFCRCQNITVKLVKGSYAEKYCKRNNIPFVYCDDTRTF